MSRPTVRQVLAEDGFRSLVWRGLATTAYRRVVVLAKDATEVGATAAAASAGLSVGRLGLEGLSAYRELRPEVEEAEYRERLERGEVCVLASLDARPVACRWYASTFAEIPYLGFSFSLPAGTAYVRDAYTAPAFRGRRLSAPVRAIGESVMKNLGTLRFVACVVPENRPGLRLTAGAGFREQGRLAVIRVPGGGRFLRRRGAEGLLGEEAELDVPWGVPGPD